MMALRDIGLLYSTLELGRWDEFYEILVLVVNVGPGL
jgi:hypothetical protein